MADVDPTFSVFRFGHPLRRSLSGQVAQRQRLAILALMVALLQRPEGLPVFFVVITSIMVGFSFFTRAIAIGIAGLIFAFLLELFTSLINSLFVSHRVSPAGTTRLGINA